MKTKLLLSTLLSFSFYLLSSQVPQGFTYQAIARDGSGSPLTGATMQVKIGILSDTIANTMVWEELFNPVKTNAFGMFNIVVGTGVKQSGSAGTFSAIDWTKTPLFLRTSIYYPDSWKVMGSTKLQSVPYSMVAANLEGTVPLLSVKGNTTTMDSALFVVRNNTGQIVFAVYNEGVRIYVDDGKAKGATKGGFAIGSFDRSKGTGQNYLTVSGDSIRMYINDVAKAVKGGFAIGGFDKSKAGNSSFFNVFTDDTGIINPSQNRVLWYPLKNAFLAGKVLIATPDSVGENSFATGYESKAKGVYSQAMGYNAISVGDYSTSIGRDSKALMNSSFAFGDGVRAAADNSFAFGKNSLASGISSYAFGDNASATGQNSYAFGTSTLAQGYASFALGYPGLDSLFQPTVNTRATGSYSFALGMGSRSSSQGSVSVGTMCNSDGQYSYAGGYKSLASGDYSVSIGINTVSSGTGSVALGNKSQATSFEAVSMGYANLASGQSSFAFGSNSKATAINSIAMGNRALASEWFTVAIGTDVKATGYGSVALGNVNQAIGGASFATGDGTRAVGSHSFSAGLWTTARPAEAFVIGQFNDTSAINTLNFSGVDPMFICGNGTSNTSRSNAFTVFQNGRTAIGHWDPTEMLDVNGNARFRAVPSWAYGTVLGITANGTLTMTTSDISMKKDIESISSALELVERMQGVWFRWKDESVTARKVGFIAQDMEKILPEVVFTNPTDGLKGINYAEITAVLAEAVKEQQKQIESYKTQLQNLQEKVEHIEALLAKAVVK